MVADGASLVDSFLKNRRVDEMVDLLLEDEYTTPTGKIGYLRGTATYYSIDTALLRIQDLHLRATGQKPIFKLDDLVPVEQAKSLYRSAVTSFMTQLAVDSKPAARTALKAVVDVARKSGSTQGFESVFLTAVTAAAQSENDEFVAQQVREFSSLSWPEILGGGLDLAVILDVRRSTLVGLDHDAIEAMIRTREIEHVSGVLGALNARAARYAVSDRQCPSLYIATSGIVFGAIGAVAGGVVGSRLGGRHGAVAGAYVVGELGAGFGRTLGQLQCEQWNREEAAVRRASEPASGTSGSNDGSSSPSSSSDDSVDKPPVEAADEKEGCVADPDAGDWDVRDPYTPFAVETMFVPVPFGRGLDAFVANNARGLAVLTAIPRLDVRMDGSLRFISEGMFQSNESFLQGISRLENLQNGDQFSRTRIGIDRTPGPFGRGGVNAETMIRESGVAGAYKALATDPDLPPRSRPLLSSSNDFRGPPDLTNEEPVRDRHHGAGFRIETRTSFRVEPLPGGDHRVDVRQVEEHTIFLDDPYLERMFGTGMLTGDIARYFAEKPQILAGIAKQGGWTTVAGGRG